MKKVQRFVVLLSDHGGGQTWLAYDNLGRIGNADFNQAFRYGSYREAELALRRVRRDRAWPTAQIMGTLVDQEFPIAS